MTRDSLTTNAGEHEGVVMLGKSSVSWNCTGHRVAPASTCKLVADGHIWHRARPKFKAGALRDVHLRMYCTETRPRSLGVAPPVDGATSSLSRDDAACFATTGTYLLAATIDTLSAYCQFEAWVGIQNHCRHQSLALRPRRRVPVMTPGHNRLTKRLNRTLVSVGG